MGTLAEDVVQMAGFSVTNQQFGMLWSLVEVVTPFNCCLGSVTSTSSNFLQNPVTGLIGLGWQSLSSSGAMPFWQVLASTGSLSSPLMAFQLTRYVWISYSARAQIDVLKHKLHQCHACRRLGARRIVDYG